MKDVIKADLRRIFKKKSFGVLMFFLLLGQVWDTFLITEETPDEIMSKAQNSLGMGYLLLVTVFIFIGVVADDKKGNIDAAQIGMGLNRQQLLLSKLYEFAVLLVTFYIFMTPLRLLMYRAFEVTISDRQMGLVAIYSVFTVIHGLICLMVAMLAELVVDNIAAGVVTLVAVTVLLTVVFRTLEIIYKVNYYSYLPGGLLNDAYANIAVGRLPWQVLPAFAYGAVIFAATAALFGKKELQL